MKVIITKDDHEMSVKAAEMIVEQVKQYPQSLLALSTGSTPIGTYQELVKLYQANQVDFSKAKCLNMDEYLGLNHQHLQGYYYFMNKHLYQYVNFQENNLFGPDAMNENIEESAREFDERIQQEGGIDLILLGIGRDGHIAFNMPDEKLQLKTHAQKLSDATIQDNARFFNSIEEVPTHAITIGINQLFNSKKVIMIANGENKSEIIRELLKLDTISTKLPASLLKIHPDFTLIIDQEAAKLL